MLIGIEPIALAAGPFAVRWFGLLALAGLAAGLWLAVRQAEAAGVPRGRVLDAAAWAIPVGVLTARAVHVLGGWEYYFTRPAEVWQLSLGGLSLWGGLLGGGLAAAWALRRDCAARAAVADAAAPGLALGLAIGRVGSFLNGDGQGTPTDLPWGTQYASEAASVPDFGVSRHPVQAYDGLILLALFGVLLVLGRRRSPVNRVWIFFLVYGLARLALGAVRMDAPFLFGLPLDQWIALPMLLYALVQLGLDLRRRQPAQPAPRSDAAAGAPVVTLYSRPGCHLCADAEADLARLRPAHAHAVRVVDITRDPRLVETYGSRVPVLVVGGREYAAPLPRMMLARILADVAR